MTYFLVTKVLNCLRGKSEFEIKNCKKYILNYSLQVNDKYQNH